MALTLAEDLALAVEDDVEATAGREDEVMTGEEDGDRVKSMGPDVWPDTLFVATEGIVDEDDLDRPG